jgi:RNA polymerase sigma-70 factor (ECF subfamily)
MRDNIVSWLGEPEVRQRLRLLARTLVDPRWEPKFDPSDIVQQTLLEAQRDAAQFRGTDHSAFEAWLRRLLVNNLANAIRHWTADKRDARLERTLDQMLADSSARMEALFTATVPGPDHLAEQAELFSRLAQAIETLPEAQRDALVLRYFRDLPVAEIARHLNRTPQAVAGLLHRGLEELRRHFT